MEKKIWKFTYAEAAAFFVALFLMVVVYIPWAANMLQGPDGTFNDVFSTWHWDTSLGRWMIILNNVLIRNDLTLPVYTASVSAIMVAVIALLWTRMFFIRSPISGALVGALTALFPCVASQMTVFYFVWLDFESCLFATLSIYVVAKSKSARGIVLGTICLCCSLGAYQTGICVAATLALFQLMFLAYNKGKWEIVIRQALRYVVMGISGCILYVAVTKVIWKLLHVIPTDFNGANTLGTIQWKFLLPRALETYKHAAAFYLEDTVFDNSAWHFATINVVILLLSILLCALLLYKKKNEFSLQFLEVGAVCLLLMPIALALIECIVPALNVNYTMCMQYVLPIIGSLKIVDYSLTFIEKCIKRTAVLLLCVLACLSNSYWMYDTAIGVVQQQNRNKAMSLANRIVYRMEDTEGYEPGMKILICGREITENYPQIYSELLYDKVKRSFASPGYMWGGIPLEQRAWTELIKQTHGIEYQTPNIETVEQIMATDIYANMPLFPEKGSVCQIEDVMVVKLTNNP